MQYHDNRQTPLQYVDFLYYFDRIELQLIPVRKCRHISHALLNHSTRKITMKWTNILITFQNR